MTPPREFGERVMKFRLERRLTQEELARKASIARNSLSEIECGVFSPSVVVLELIADAMGVPPAEFFKPIDGPMPPKIVPRPGRHSSFYHRPFGRNGG